MRTQHLRYVISDIDNETSDRDDGGDDENNDDDIDNKNNRVNNDDNNDDDDDDDDDDDGNIDSDEYSLEFDEDEISSAIRKDTAVT